MSKKKDAEYEAYLRNKNQETNSSSLDFIFASDLSFQFNPPDELLEGIFVVGESSVIYGASNSGKTFVAIDMAASISRGSLWMDRRTEAGLIIYLAAESPSSVKRRLQAYQAYYNVRLPNFAIVQNPIDLFNGESDTKAIIQLTRDLEKQTGKKARLIVGDTLARISAGANENAGEDMGVVIRHFDMVRAETDAHFTLVHHSGKNAAAGGRGWSGVRAASDTELEVTNAIEGRCIEITKQRDLDSNGTRIGFRLEPVTLGKTKWGTEATTCVVLPWGAPTKQRKLLSGAAAAVEEYMINSGQTIDKKVCVKHFKNRYHRTTILRVFDSFLSDGLCTELNGFYTKVDGKW